MKNIIPQALLTMPILSTGLQAQEKQPTPNPLPYPDSVNSDAFI